MRSLRFILTIVAFAFVALPAKAASIIETAQAAGQFNTLIAAVKAAGLVDALSGRGPFTVFAP
ncbi:MAG: fasciclin domain-containing protein, partial [Alsobacter sp.]